MINYARDHTVADGLDYIATWQAGMYNPETDMMEAFKAKAEKRPGKFSTNCCRSGRGAAGTVNSPARGTGAYCAAAWTWCSIETAGPSLHTSVSGTPCSSIMRSAC